ncbi:TadE/TadG family type IV pilus assembly protein [Cupriavidus agavae]|uniref:Flp pilus assembly protein TadG n=1 Tax=Cupriavidus agavae TaxID=1001822 RepID=A0A4Q7R941_9BURK|nr:TadE/TadG family type IV pilus assembly protein [Cupriavidus agavae]RZT29354.1 Flp pilus assembly protein TadG [Cupriavidus agavae]
MASRGDAHRHRDNGAVAVEFALVFPVLLALVLGIAYYGVILAMQQVLTLAAEEGARAALRYPLTSNNGTLAETLALRVSAADQTARGVLPASVANGLLNGSGAQAMACTAPPGQQCVQVTLNLRTSTLLPVVPFVPVPTTLTGHAVVQLSPDI